MASKKKVVAPTSVPVAVLMADFGSYKKGEKVPVIGKDVLIDGKTYKISELNDEMIKITTSDAVTPIYDEHFMEKLVRHSVEDAQSGRYKVGDNVTRFSIEELAFVSDTIEEGDEGFLKVYLRSGLVLPADTTITKAARRLANISKAYTLNLSDEDIASIVTSYEGWFVKPEAECAVCPTQKLADVLEAIAKKL